MKDLIVSVCFVILEGSRVLWNVVWKGFAIKHWKQRYYRTWYCYKKRTMRQDNSWTDKFWVSFNLLNQAGDWLLYIEFWGHYETNLSESIKEELSILKQAKADLILKTFSFHFTLIAAGNVVYERKESTSILYWQSQEGALFNWNMISFFIFSSA